MMQQTDINSRVPIGIISMRPRIILAVRGREVNTLLSIEKWEGMVWIVKAEMGALLWGVEVSCVRGVWGV